MFDSHLVAKSDQRGGGALFNAWEIFQISVNVCNRLMQDFTHCANTGSSEETIRNKQRYGFKLRCNKNKTPLSNNFIHRGQLYKL